MTLDFETQLVHGLSETEGQRATQPPIHQSTSFSFPNFQTAIDRFEMTASGATYTRSGNPTVDALGTKIAALEGGIGGLCTASGHAAQLVALMPLMQPGDEIIGARQLYGGSTNQFQQVFPKHFGWQGVSAQDDTPEAIARAITERSRAIFIESIANPSGAIADIEAIARIAEAHHIPLIVDNTMASPYLCRPFNYGATIITHSTTKYLTGNGTAIGGVIVDSGTFNWAKDGRYPALTQPSGACNNLILHDHFAELAYLAYARAIGVRDLGACQQPINAFFTLIGLETLALRLQKQVENAEIVAQWLRQHPQVSRVSRPLATSPLAQKYLAARPGPVFTFDLQGASQADCGHFIEALQLFQHVVNIGDTRSLIVHPASTTHKQLTDAQRKACHIGENTLRLSLGIEAPADLTDDLQRGFASISAP